MSEILKSLGLTPPAVTIIVGLGGVVYWFFRQGLKQLSDQDNTFKNKVQEDLEEIKKGLVEVRDEDRKQNKALVQVLYHQCLDEALKWKDKGYIDGNAKIQFNIQWNKYLELGDGLGDEPKTIIEKLEIKN